MEESSYQLNVELSHHLHLQVDDVPVTGVPAAETQADTDGRLVR